MNLKDKLLLQRAQMFNLIGNLRQVRKDIRSKKFGAELYNQLNGNDAALESLVGHDVTFEMLDQQGQVKLRREILSQLTESEIKAFGALRECLVQYFKDIDAGVQAVESMKDWVQPRNVRDPKDFDVTDGAFTKAGLKDVELAMNKVCDFLHAVSPMMSRILDTQGEPELPSEAEVVHQSIPAGPVVEPPAKEQPTEPNAEPDKTIEIEPQPETIEKVQENEDTAALQEVISACASNRSIGMCDDHYVPVGTNLKDIGYGTPEAAINSIRKVEQIEHNFVKAVKVFRDVVPCNTCVGDLLYRGTNKFYDAMDALTDLVRKAEGLRQKLENTRTSLVKALEKGW